MNTAYKTLVLATALTATAATGLAQDLNSAYFTDDYKYRHDINPAFGNDQGYTAIPILGNLNIKVQGNVGAGDVLFKNPRYGMPGEKKTVTFMHPSISYDEAMKGFSDRGLKVAGDIKLTIVSVGFKAFGGYNTIELNEKTMFGLSLPKDLMEFAKNTVNDNYTFDDMAVRAYSYAELAFGHSRQIDDQWRVGAKVKALIGGARADVEVKDMHASLVGDTWLLEGKAKGQLSLKGAELKTKTEEYKARYVTGAGGAQVPQTYQKVDDLKVDGGGIGGFGLGLDLGAVYKLNDDFTFSAAITDLGFISWSNNVVAETPGGQFTFDGFHDIAVRDAYATTGNTFSDKGDEYGDQLADFLNLESKGDQGGRTTALAATASLGAEYTLPAYDKLSFGLLAQQRFNGKFSCTEGRLSANWRPLRWLNGGINFAANSYSASMGWILNVHPKGYNFFIGMDHLLGKHTKEFIPVSDANVSLALGMNITW